MSETNIRERLASLSPGTSVTVKLDDGSTVTGDYQGTEGEQVILADGAGSVELEHVETVLLDVSTEGPE